MKIPSVDKASSEKVERFILENRGVKGVHHLEETNLLIKGIALMNIVKDEKGKTLKDEEKKDFLTHIVRRIVADESNEFKEEQQLVDSIDTLVKLASGKIKIKPKNVLLCCLKKTVDVLDDEVR